jgi:hypothetical protein
MDQQSPGFMTAVADYLRRKTGLGGNTDPSVAGAVQTLQQLPQDRALQIKAAEMGMTPEQYQQMLLQQGPR